MTRDNKFKEMISVTEAAKSLAVSTATLRKYSVLVEDVTGNSEYYDKTKQNSRLYSEKNITDLKSVKSLSKKSGFTLKDAARQIFAISSKADKQPVTKTTSENENVIVNDKQVAKLLTMLQQTISSQNDAINDLRKQVAQIETQNKKLLDNTKTLEAPKQTKPKIKKYDDVSIGDIDDLEKPELTREEEHAKAVAEIAANKNKSGAQVHDEIMRKTIENQKKRGQDNIHRTLSDMQIPKDEHWWNHILKIKK